MELTVDQMLQQGVAAHNAGNPQEAERLYRAILQVQPKHPDANHNLGLIAVSMNQSGVALPLFKNAIKVNPNIEQFWLSYIEALLAERQFENAKQALKKGKKKGVAKEKLKALTQKLVSVKAGNIPIQAPSEAATQKLLNHYQNGQYGDAETLAISITEQFPGHQFGWKVMGALLEKTGRKSEALNANQKAVQLEPEDAEAHYNLGNTLMGLGRLEEAEASYKQTIALKSDYAEARNNLGMTLQALGRLEEAEASYRHAIALKSDYAEAHSNLGNTLKELGRLEEAEASYKQTIALKSDYAEARNNLGMTLQAQGKLEEAEASYRQAITMKPDYAEAHSNLGNTLKELGRLEEAEASLRQAIALKPNYAEAHSNLGVTLKELGRLEEAEASYRQAIALKPDFAETHINLGITLQELGRLEEAEASLRQAIALKSDYAEAHHQLGIILYINGGKDSALKSIKKAHDIGSKSKDVELLLAVLKSRKSSEKSGVKVGDLSNPVNLAVLIPNRLILNRVVEAELIANLYEMSSRELDKTKDSRFGNGACSLDFNLFKDTRPIIKTVAEDLTRIMTEAVKSEIYIYDSFFNILGAGGGTTPHHHLNKLDKIKAINLGKKKYSLVYYLSEGDQNCREPGILKLYDPSEDILPCEGMITITSATRRHSSVYAGRKDRVMVGVNFYSL